MARLGALMVAWNPEQREALAGIRAKAAENGYEETRAVDLEELYAREPNLGPGAEGAIEIPGEGIVCPFTTTLAFATEAVRGGCELSSTPRSWSPGERAADTSSIRTEARSAPSTWSTRRGYGATRSTRCSATANSGLRRGGGS